jgi:hypothetical protein
MKSDQGHLKCSDFGEAGLSLRLIDLAAFIELSLQYKAHFR